ncbi:MAG: hypothetical protein HC906_14915, partial [Bacteroidales bacterium]|nr:hypothetical protein [Bacteroidales bacterium]
MKMLKLPDVQNVSAASGIPGLETLRNGYLPEGSDVWHLFDVMHVDDNFLNTFQLKILEGRDFRQGESTDNDVFIVNEADIQ